MKNLMIPLQDAYLCPGDEDSGAHVTDNSVCCPCGNSNLASLARILDRDTGKPLEKYSLFEIETGYAGLVAGKES